MNKVICTNKNNWYEHEDKMCGFLEYRPGIKGIVYNQVCEVESSFLDRHGDLFYMINGQAYEAEFFAITLSSKEKVEAAGFLIEQ